MSASELNAASIDKRPRHWFLVRGLVREASHWGPFPQVLLKRFPNSTIQTLDLPGFGDQREIQSPWRISTIAELVREQAHFPQDDRDCHIVAISLGAMVSMDWLREKPTGIKSAVFINTSLNMLSPFWERLRPANYLTILKILRSSSAREREKLILQMTTRLTDIEKWLPQWTKIAEKNPASVRTALAQLVAASTFTGNLEPPPRPVLVLRSLGDQLVNPKASEKIAKSWHVPLCTHPSAGHDIPLDDPQWVAEQIFRFISV